MDSFRLLWKDRQGRGGRWVVLYMRVRLDCVALSADDNTVVTLWVRLKGKANKADVVGVNYQPPSQDDHTDGLFYKESRDVSRSAALVLTGGYNFPDVSWEYHTADRNRSRKFLEHVEENFLV